MRVGGPAKLIFTRFRAEIVNANMPSAGTP